ncbi:hypothetical protein GCM10009733_092080 [Nonomuraea maheshkhaliensis]|uniref:Uncharacterized protein n=1 Tax=Nonomuraea maheshkhaliensis TaxID=419590 RepID=A0ABP4T1S5_9ACTN
MKTLHAYACPMARCTESAAGGTSHRLQVGAAMVRERLRNPAELANLVLSATHHGYHIRYAVFENRTSFTASGQFPSANGSRLVLIHERCDRLTGPDRAAP